MRVSQMDETNEHSVQAIIEESYAHEREAIEKYFKLVGLTKDKSVFLEEYARSMVAAGREAYDAAFTEPAVVRAYRGFFEQIVR